MTALATLALAATAVASPVEITWPVAGPDDTSALAAAAYSGWYAAADTFDDSVEIRDIRAALRFTIARPQIAALLPWMSLDGGPDGPNAVALTATGRVLYILVTDSDLAGDGLGSDAVLRFDIPSGLLSVFARLDAFDRGDAWPHLAMVHQKGRLFVGTVGAGIKVYDATRNSVTGALQTTIALPGGTSVRGLTVDRDLNNLYIGSDSGIWRTSLNSFPTTSLTSIVTAANSGGDSLRALAWADTYGNAGLRGLYLLVDGSGVGELRSLSPVQAQSSSPQVPSIYHFGDSEWHDLASTADGKLLIGADEDAVLLRDTADTRMSFDAWMADEFQQHVTFARGLISPDGEPSGWVIDGDTEETVPASARFHPATPDGAGWVLLALVMNHHLTGDATAQASARTVLTRYANFQPAVPDRLRSADGMYKHWIDPSTRDTQSGWPDEYATLSTMKLVMGAARAMQQWPDDPQIALAAGRIIFRTKNWDAYLAAGGAGDGDESMAFKGIASGAAGADPFSFSRGFHEGIIFVEQAGTYGGAFAAGQRIKWLNRAQWPTATFLTGRSISTANFGQYDSAFLSLYPMLVSQPYRADAGWRTQVQNVRWSNAAWTDDNGPRFYTVFSAGTTLTGYNADSLASNNHAGDITTFTSLLALCASGDNAEAVAGYAAFRKGARQDFSTGASLLYRRSATTPGFTPNSAGLPDVTLGGLGLAEIIRPGSIDAVLARPYPTAELCPVDVNASGAIDIEDLYRRVAAPSDLNGDGLSNLLDIACLRAWLRRNERTDGSIR